MESKFHIDQLVYRINEDRFKIYQIIGGNKKNGTISYRILYLNGRLDIFEAKEELLEKINYEQYQALVKKTEATIDFLNEKINRVIKIKGGINIREDLNNKMASLVENMGYAKLTLERILPYSFYYNEEKEKESIRNDDEHISANYKEDDGTNGCSRCDSDPCICCDSEY